MKVKKFQNGSRYSKNHKKTTFFTVKSCFSAYVSIFESRIDLTWFQIQFSTFSVIKVKVQGQKYQKMRQILQESSTKPTFFTAYASIFEYRIDLTWF